MKRNLIYFLIVITISTLFSGCKKETSKKQSRDIIELTYYKLFDNEEVIKPLIQEFQSKNRNIRINYKKFTDVEEYENLIINELAEGEGPDIFELHNTWLPRHYKKITPLPEKLMSEAQYRDIFVDTAATDFMRFNAEQKKNLIYGIPLYVDTLALYYNDDIYEDKVPSRGKPPDTWSELEQDVFKINSPDTSSERFKVAGIAMGRADNILRAIDTLYLLFLQNRTDFYDDDYKKAAFSGNQGVSAVGQTRNPAKESLEFFISFAKPNQKNYSWNQYFAKAESAEKEIIPFAKGKIAMIFGYSYLYNDIIETIKRLENSNQDTIKTSNVKIAPVPQIFPEKKRAYASYFAETVSRTSKHPEEAWKFLKFLASKESLTAYYENTKRPTSRRDLIEEQKSDPIYGVYAIQLGYARSLPQYHDGLYKKIFEQMIDEVLSNSVSVIPALKNAENEINALIPPDGLYPPADKK